MIPAGMIVDDVLNYMHAQEDKVQRARVWRVLNLQYFELCAKYSWKNLRATTALDFTTVSDETGLYIPSDVAGVDMVRDDDDDFEFVERNQADIEPDESGYRYYRYRPSESDLYYGSDLSLTSGDSSFTSASLTAAITAGSPATVLNQYVRFGSELGMYKITNNTSPYTFTPAYYGPSLEGTDEGTFTIRPHTTEKLIIMDAAEEILEDRTVNLYYWKLPRPLYRDQDPILLPTSEALKLKVLRELPEAKVLRPVSENELKNATEEALRMNPDFIRSSNPRDRHNSIFSFGTCPFKERDS